MPEPEPEPEPEPQAAGWQRLRSALVSRPSRGQAVMAVLLALLGFAAAVQVRSTDASTEFAGARRGDLVQLLDSLGAAEQRAREQLAELQRTREELRTSSDRARAAVQEAREEAIELAILSGAAPTTGPGVTLTIEDPQDAVGAQTMLNAVQELRDAGAEAIQVNHAVRLVQSSYVAGTPGMMMIDGRTVRAPYVIQAIGSAHTLSDAVGFPGGLADEISSLGGTVTVEEEDSVEVDALHPAEQPQYSHPTGQ